MEELRLTQLEVHNQSYKGKRDGSKLLNALTAVYIHHGYNPKPWTSSGWLRVASGPGGRCVCTWRAMKASRGAGSLWTSRRALISPFPKTFSGTNFLLLIITCPAAFLSPACTNTAQGEGGLDLFFSFQVMLSQALLKVKDKWRGNEATYLLFFFFLNLFSRRKEHWNIGAEEQSSQGASSTGLVRGQ